MITEGFTVLSGSGKNVKLLFGLCVAGFLMFKCVNDATVNLIEWESENVDNLNLYKRETLCVVIINGNEFVLINKQWMY